MKTALVSLHKVKHPRYAYVATYMQGGARRKHYFADKASGKHFAAAKAVELKNEGTKRDAVTDAEKAALLVFRSWAAGIGPDAPSLSEAIHLATTTWEAGRGRTLTVEALCEARLEELYRTQKSARHIADVEGRLAKFTAAFGERLAHTLTSEEITGWLHSMPVGVQSLHHYRAVISAVFEGRISPNPCGQVKLPEVVRDAPVFLSPGETFRLLEAAHPDIRPLLVLQAFCGVRRAESLRLAWHDLNLDEAAPYLSLGNAITKTKKRRTIEIPENALAWLRLDRRPDGVKLEITPWQYQQHLEAAAKAAGIAWSENLLRHGFGTYRLSVKKDAAAVALEMGNSPAVLLEHYQNLCSPAAAIAYWQIRPTATAANITAHPHARTA